MTQKQQKQMERKLRGLQETVTRMQSTIEDMGKFIVEDLSRSVAESTYMAATAASMVERLRDGNSYETDDYDFRQ